MRLATWNVNSLPVRMPRLVDWLATASPDVLCLQETKVAEEAFPHAQLTELGYEVASHGSGRWNGVAILSKVGLADVRRGFAGEPGFPEPEARAVGALCANVRVWSVYAPNGRTLADPHYAYKLAWLDALRAAIVAGEPAAHLAVCGDFNVAPSDADVWDPVAFVDSTHVSAAERAAVAALCATGLVDVQPRAIKGLPFTYWDYRAGNFHKGFGMRIDLVLLDTDLATRVTDAWIDRDARKGHLPSDHAPVIVDIGVDTGTA